jgi:hypothetical protein
MNKVIKLELFLRLWPIGWDAMQSGNYLEKPAASIVKAEDWKRKGEIRT